MTIEWPYAVRSSNVCAKLFADIPWSTCNLLVHTMIGGGFAVPYRNT